MRTLVLSIEYDGTDFLGWQIQPSGRTVQSELQAALKTILQTDTRVMAAGRTDTGVHARGQVVHFKTTTSLACDRILKSLNSVLPSDICVHSVKEAPDQFHARFSAIGRRYLYRIIRRPSAIKRLYAWYVSYPVDVNTIQQACLPLIGHHDFTSFCQATSTADGTMCEIQALVWREHQEELYLYIEANRFLHHMVRTIVGTAIDIGRGRWEPTALADMLDARDRRAAGENAPPQGLCLEKIIYPPEYDIG